MVIMSQTPEWLFNQLRIEKRKLDDKEQDSFSRKELLTMIGASNQFDRLKELKGA